ncbi:MAG TPA: hypothetical protein VGW74_14785, partial [Propionibacteriaceae bacterium]|nr:hypothetical protein [Propionibacteriaceae bacterium]
SSVTRHMPWVRSGHREPRWRWRTPECSPTCSAVQECGPASARRTSSGRRPRVNQVQQATVRMTRVAGLPTVLRDLVAPVVGPHTYRRRTGRYGVRPDWAQAVPRDEGAPLSRVFSEQTTSQTISSY